MASDSPAADTPIEDDQQSDLQASIASVANLDASQTLAESGILIDHDATLYDDKLPLEAIIEPEDDEWIIAREAGVLAAVATDDLDALRRYSVLPGGYGTDPTRRRVWAHLLRVQYEDTTTTANCSTDRQRNEPVEHAHDESAEWGADSSTDLAEMKESLVESQRDDQAAAQASADDKHPDESQVLLDTKRSFVYYPEGLSPQLKQRLQDDLEYLIVHTLRAHPVLSYFQGYHDILSVFYLTYITLPDDKLCLTKADRGTPEWTSLLRCCEAVSLFRVRDGMGKGLQPLMGLLRILKRLLKAADPELARFSAKISPIPTLPFFALSWILCLFSHDINTLSPIQRIFDYLLARNPIAAIYLAVAMLMSKKRRLFELYVALDEDPTSLHPFFSRLPPLVADTPSSPSLPSPLPLSQKEIHDIMHSTDSAASKNPHEPIYLSSLFEATDSLLAEFPPDHPEVRMYEIMGPGSMVRTYDAELGGDFDLAQAESLVLGDKDGWEILVEPALEPSDDEDEDEVPPEHPKLERTAQGGLGIPRLGTALAISVLVVGIGFAVYTSRERHPKGWAELRRMKRQASLAVWDSSRVLRDGFWGLWSA